MCVLKVEKRTDLNPHLNSLTFRVKQDHHYSTDPCNTPLTCDRYTHSHVAGYFPVPVFLNVTELKQQVTKDDYSETPSQLKLCSCLFRTSSIVYLIILYSILPATDGLLRNLTLPFPFFFL